MTRTESEGTSADDRSRAPGPAVGGPTYDPLRTALAQLTEGVIVTDAAGRITFVNEAAERLHGAAVLDIEPEAYAATYHLFTEDGREYPSAELPLSRAVRHGETVVDARWRIRRPDGTEVHAVGSARPLRGPDGTRVGAVLTVRDDTARVAAQATERERDLLAARLRAAFEQSPVSTVVYDATGRPLAVNPAFERLWGASMRDVPADYSVFGDPQLEAAGVMPLIRRAFAGETVMLPPLRYEMESAVGRGRVLWTQAHLYPVRDAEGTVAQVVLSHEDVTARLTAEEELAATARRAERLQVLTAALAAASTPDEVAHAVVVHGVEVLDAAGIVITRLSADGRHLEIMRVGDMPEDVQEEWRRFPVDAPAPLADAARSGAPVFLASREQWAARYPHLLPLLDASGHHANAVAPLVVEGRVLGVMGAAFDRPREFSEVDRALVLTVAQQCGQALERARLFEAERAARRDAEHANRAKAEFLAAVSHELRTPLNAIGGYVELMEMGIRGPLTAQQREDLRRIQQSQRHLLGLINQVLNYARLETGAVHYDIVAVPAREALVSAEALVAPQARAKGITIAVGDCPAALAVRADPEKLRQILVNLLSNAVKFTDAGGRIDLACEPGETELRLQVRDSGCGIPADKLEAIFEPFVQVDARLTRMHEGVGLGLAISRDLARGMGGDLTARSAPRAGSTFTIVLPRA